MRIEKAHLIELGLSDTWQYFVSAFNATEALRVYRLIEEELLKKKSDNFKDIVNGIKELPEVERKAFPPGDFCPIGEVNVSLSFLYNLNTGNFFQAASNFFDYLSQIINLVYLDESKRIDKVDFGKLIRKKDSISSSGIVTLITDIAESENYQFICDYNNTVKHNHGINTTIYTSCETLEMSGKVAAFSKEIQGIERKHDSAVTSEKMKEAHQFVSDAFESFTNEFAAIYNGQKG